MRDYRFLALAVFFLSLGVYGVTNPERVRGLGGIGTDWPIWMHRALGIALIVFAILMAGLFLTQSYRP
jgi:hypothetical protein